MSEIDDLAKEVRERGLLGDGWAYVERLIEEHRGDGINRWTANEAEAALAEVRAHPHVCTFCRCRFPREVPNLVEMMANHGRVLAELREAKRRLKKMRP